MLVLYYLFIIIPCHTIFVLYYLVITIPCHTIYVRSVLSCHNNYTMLYYGNTVFIIISCHTTLGYCATRSGQKVAMSYDISRSTRLSRFGGEAVLINKKIQPTEDSSRLINNTSKNVSIRGHRLKFSTLSCKAMSLPNLNNFKFKDLTSFIPITIITKTL